MKAPDLKTFRQKQLTNQTYITHSTPSLNCPECLNSLKYFPGIHRPVQTFGMATISRPDRLKASLMWKLLVQ